MMYYVLDSKCRGISSNIITVVAVVLRLSIERISTFSLQQDFYYNGTLSCL